MPCNTALWRQTHFGSRPQSTVNFTPHFRVKRTLGQNREINPKVRYMLRINALWVPKVLNVSTEFCLNTEYLCACISEHF